MKSKYLILCLFLCVGTCAMASPIAKDVALQKALTFLSCTDRHATIDTFSISGRAFTYKVVTDRGWVLLSTESSITPILAYSTEENFPNIEDMPPGMKWLFSYYEDAISYAKQHQNELASVNVWDVENNHERSMTSMDTVILTRLGQVYWGQDYSNDDFSCDKIYNKFCPSFYPKSCNKNVVGCIAVALGQVLWYYQWPYYATVPSAMLDSLGNVSSQNTNKHYDWSLMPFGIYLWTPANKSDSIASFLKDCGYAIKTNYRYNSSSSNFNNTLYALQHNFDYSTAQAISRSSQPSTWIQLMKNELRNGRPIIYRGDSPNSNGDGHAFVIYGFEENYFLVNWGWNGDGNSVRCTLDNLCPDPWGVGYNDNQWAIINIEPTYSYSPINGNGTLCSTNVYSLVGIPSEASVHWSYDTNIQQVGSYPIITISDTLSPTITVQRGSYYIFPSFIEELYSGIVTLKATITYNGVTKVFTKAIILPEDITPTIPLSQRRKIGLDETRTFCIDNCTNVPWNQLKWVITLPSATSSTTYYGRCWSITTGMLVVHPGTMNIKLYNLENCDPTLYTDYNITISYLIPDPLLSFANPVTTGTVEINVTDRSYSQRDGDADVEKEKREDIDYTLELWSENSRTVKTINSTLRGEKDVVTMDVSNLPNGIYFLTMKVDNEVLTTEKMIINH